MENDIETAFPAAIDAGKINGAVICVMDAEGRFVYDKALGERILLSGERRPQQLDNILYLVLATKLMTIIAALQCVEDGLLILTGDILSIVPEIASERMQQRLFDPLGIDDAQFYLVTREELRSRLVDLNPDDPDGLGRAVVGGGGSNHSNSQTRGNFGGHGLFMSGASFVKVLHSLLVNDGKLLKPSTVDDMFQHHLTPQATAGHQVALAGPLGSFFRVGIDPTVKLGFGLGGLLTLQDADGFYGGGTLTWGGGRTLIWFIDRKNGLCGIGAIQAALPFHSDTVEALKGILGRDIYRKYGAWKAQL